MQYSGGNMSLAPDMRAPGAILLVATYELGHQPLSLAWPLAYLRRAGYAPAAIDTAVEELPDEAVCRARLVAIATPMHTALRLAVPLAERVRALNPAAHRCAYGLYAGLNADYLLGSGLVDSVVSGETEAALLALVQALECGDAGPVPGVGSRQGPAAPVRTRLDLPVPERASLPAAPQYAGLLIDGETRPAGYAETTRGCKHTCRHCPLTPVYQGRFFAVPLATVMADIRQQVAAGVRHITFGDPDFLNGPTHALRVTRALHAEFPAVTFDATIKIEHILQHPAIFPELRDLGCFFVVSAVESLSDEVLRRLDKGHTRADVFAALRILDEAGIALRPSLLAFTPWTTLADYLDLLDWVEAEGLAEHVDPVHFAIRLLVPPGSALLAEPDTAAWLGDLDAANFTYTWRHPDPRLDELHAEVAALVERATRARQAPAETLAAIRELAKAAAGPLRSGRGGVTTAVRMRPSPPRLTHTWFC